MKDSNGRSRNEGLSNPSINSDWFRESQEKAIDYFKEAFKSFDEVDHFIGMWQSKVNEFELF